ncbi:lipoprotein [Leptospira andrefontaineae]|uniref:Lipoprotein n=1 Tax=Leptospira andrefontaineae TaxID=2484976 RepID=A0A4R9H6N2_9LEPT|nr:lipoprotein [Leptospira andrefontaineae]TGK41261.1 lipoprotein [Leptospira andrefontaineae]
MKRKILYIILIGAFFNDCSMILEKFYPAPISAKEGGKSGVVIIGEIKVKDSTGSSFVGEIFKESLHYEFIKEGFSPFVIEESGKEIAQPKNRIAFGDEANVKLTSMQEAAPKDEIQFVGKSDQELKSIADKTKFEIYTESSIILKEVGSSILDGKYSVLIFVRVFGRNGKRIGEVKHITSGNKEKLDSVISDSSAGIVKRIRELVKND